MAYSYSQLVALAQQAGFPADQAGTAAAVALAESSGNAGATNRNSNRSTDFGLWQINSVHRGLLAGKDWADPLVNARMAYQVWADAGRRWTPWTTFKSGAYRKYLGSGGSSPAGASTSASVSTVTGSAPAVGGDPFAGVTASLSGIGESFQGIAAFATTVNKLALPQTWVRIMSGVFGAVLVGFGLIMLTREVKD